jgi:hypothetical protein
MIAADNSGCYVSGHDITLYIGIEGTVECLEGKIFSRIPKILTDRAKSFLKRQYKLFGFNYSAALIRAATGACMVWKPGITALGTTGQIRGCNLLMSPPLITL